MAAFVDEPPPAVRDDIPTLADLEAALDNAGDESALDIWKRFSKAILRRYFVSEERRGIQLAARFYAEANFRILASRHVPPFQFTASVYPTLEVERLRMPWNFIDGLVSPTLDRFDVFPVASSFFGDIVRNDTTTYLAMQWLFNPGSDGSFSPIEPLVNDVDFFKMVDRFIQQPEQQASNLKARMLKGGLYNATEGRIDVFQILSQLYTSFLEKRKPMSGAQCLTHIFKTLIPVTFTDEIKSTYWRYVSRVVHEIFGEWNTRYMDLEDPDSPLQKRLFAYVRKMRNVCIHYARSDDMFPEESEWSKEVWTDDILLFYNDRTPELVEAKRIFDQFTLMNQQDINDAIIDNQPVDLDMLPIVDVRHDPIDIAEYNDFFYKPDIMRTTFVTACLFTYIRFIQAGFVLPFTGSVRSIQLTFRRDKKQWLVSEMEKLSSFTSYCVHRAFQRGYSETFAHSVTNSFPQYRYMISANGRTTKDIIMALLSRWKLLRNNEKNTKWFDLIDENVRLLSASILKIDDMKDNPTRFSNDEIEEMIRKTKEMIIQ